MSMRVPPRLLVAGNSCYYTLEDGTAKLAPLDRDSLDQFLGAWSGTIEILGSETEVVRRRSEVVDAWEFYPLLRGGWTLGVLRLIRVPWSLVLMRARARDSDVVYARLPSPNGFWLLAATVGLPVRRMVSLHGLSGSQSGSSTRRFLTRWVYHAMLRHVDVVFSTSAEVAIEYSSPPPRTVIYRSSILKKVRPSGRSPDWSSKSIRLGFIGRLEKEKDPRFFLRVVRALIDDGWEVSASILGDGALREDILQRVRDQGLPVSVVGWVDGQEAVMEFIGTQDLILNTSPREGSPKALVECMAAGVPTLIRSTNSIVEEYARGGGIGIVGDDDPLAWASAVASIWNRASYEAMVQHGLETAGELTIENLQAFIRGELAKAMEGDGS